MGRAPGAQGLQLSASSPLSPQAEWVDFGAECAGFQGAVVLWVLSLKGLPGKGLLGQEQHLQRGSRVTEHMARPVGTALLPESWRAAFHAWSVAPVCSRWRTFVVRLSVAVTSLMNTDPRVVSGPRARHFRVVSTIPGTRRPSGCTCCQAWAVWKRPVGIFSPAGCHCLRRGVAS